MVTAGGKLIEMPIKGLPMIISPSGAQLVDEWTIFCNNNFNMLKRSVQSNEEWSESHFLIFTRIPLQCAQLSYCKKNQTLEAILQ